MTHTHTHTPLTALKSYSPLFVIIPLCQLLTHGLKLFAELGQVHTRLVRSTFGKGDTVNASQAAEFPAGILQLNQAFAIKRDEHLHL